jgi:5'-nucleotidase (lipoprotein e(P4) family)
VPSAPPALKAESPAGRGLDAALYVQTAAEYRACCLQAYNLAACRLREGVERTKNAAKKPAVILDLDETVLDNSGFEALLVRSGIVYDQRLWDLWEEESPKQVALVPGAGDFIHEAERLGVTVVYVSNRSHRKPTAATLERLGVPAKKDEFLKLKADKADPGDKTGRFKEVEDQFEVLLYVGDNLRDFDDHFRFTLDDGKDGRTTDPAKLDAAIQERKEKVDKVREKWGSKWIILPNPQYGEWTAPLGLGVKDQDRLVPEAKK